MAKIFECSAFTYVEELKQKAIAEVNLLSMEDLADPALAGRLDRIAATYTPKFLTLEAPTQGLKRSRSVDRDDYGMHEPRVINYLDVIIPFQGDPDLLRVSPSRQSIPALRFAVEGRSLVASVQDDEQTKKSIEDFCFAMRENFSVMMQDLERYLPQLRPALTDAAERRLKAHKAEQERHSKLPFPVR